MQYQFNIQYLLRLFFMRKVLFFVAFLFTTQFFVGAEAGRKDLQEVKLENLSVDTIYADGYLQGLEIKDARPGFNGFDSSVVDRAWFVTQTPADLRLEGWSEVCRYNVLARRYSPIS